MAVQEDDRDQLLRLQAITDAALAHLELDDLLAELLERIAALLEVDTCAVLLADEETNEVVARAAVGLEEEVERGTRIPIGAGFVGRVAAGRRPVHLPDVDHADVQHPVLLEKGVKSLLGVPLVVGGQMTGVLHVGSLTPRAFTPEETELLQLVGDRVALAIDHARTLEGEREARLRLEHVQSVTDAALAHLGLDELLPELLQRVTVALGTDTAAVLLLDEERDELVATAAVGIEEEVEAGVRIPVGGGFAGRVAAERMPVILDDVDHAHVLNPILREKGIKSMLGVPLVARDAVIGVMHVGTLVHRRFVRSDVELLQVVAERVALAIERARLHEQMVRLDQMKLNFVAIASHELRTPATAVYGALLTIRARRDQLRPEILAELEETAFRQSDRMRRLIEQLLDLSRLDARSINIEPQPLVLRSVLGDIAAGDDVAIDVDPALAIVADPLVIDRVVTNLVANARTYGRPPIRIGAEISEEHVRVTVTDAGDGVPGELVPRLFERFERGPGDGTGLGLAIARAYAAAHGGELVYAPSPSGARFDLLLPR